MEESEYLEAVALHEAGHALAACLVNVDIVRITMNPPATHFMTGIDGRSTDNAILVGMGGWAATEVMGLNAALFLTFNTGEDQDLQEVWRRVRAAGHTDEQCSVIIADAQLKLVEMYRDKRSVLQHIARILQENGEIDGLTVYQIVRNLM